MNASIAESLIQRGEDTYNSIQWFRERLEVGDVLLVLTNSGNNIGMKEDLRIEDPMLFEVKRKYPYCVELQHKTDKKYKHRYTPSYQRLYFLTGGGIYSKDDVC